MEPQKENEYLPIDKIIKLAKKRGVDFGKSNPYNRLRYYTKIGLLPNMVRIKSQGNYPDWALEKLVRIEEYKNQGFDNEKIKKIFEKEKLTIKLDPTTKKKWLNYFGLGLLIAVLSLGIIQSTINNTQLINKEKTGSYQIPSNSPKVFVFDQRVTKESKIFVMFNNNYAPATSYYISSKIPNTGFELSFNSPIPQGIRFDYWIVK